MVVDGLVETEARLKLPLQLGMEIKIVVPQRLLDHQQVESVKLFQVLNLLERVGGIGVAAQKNLWPAGAYLLEYLYIPARLALHLDATVACRQFSVDFLEQLLV